MTISDIIKNTKCPFAKNAKMADPIIIDSLDLFHQINSVKSLISNFFINAPKLKYDALCLIFTDPLFGDTIEHLSQNTYNFFKATEVIFNDFKVPEEILDYNEIWWPSIENERFFLVSFASCYSKHSPRFNHGDQSTYFFLQPVSSFENHAKDGNAVSDELRIKIRELFSKHHQPYDGSISCLKNELVKMVHPLHFGDKIVQWWKATGEVI